MKWDYLIQGFALVGLGLFAGAAHADDSRPPTARYAAGEEVDLALIVTEWKDRYPDIPVFACACDAASCDSSARWPFRRYDRYQLTVSLGPFNGAYTESLGFNCLDIESGQGLNEVSQAPPEPMEPPEENLAAPNAAVSADRTSLVLTWPDARTNRIDVTGWTINILDALDCETLTQVPEKTFSARFIAGDPVVDPLTDNVAVPVVLDECVETQVSAVFVVDPQGVAAYGLYRVQVPGAQPLANEFSSYGLSSISGVHYWDSTLLVRNGSASGAETMLMFRPYLTPAGKFVACGTVTPGEGDAILCPAE
ncbi:hypothetical protein [Leptothoe kymatousa]|uniref:Uncharacterized protein n=1 Tax=Leptothoe kymatousa TAU-MAC 1615 TaxID=2364775 RepID=A0ABS5Y0R0_9CYAN|nr:hypothetical protein [Leptothoe kymatousa]MBT9311405.1 hypothetical protein [Leptothoe kymatousa TAU-MAC 1615]